MYRNKPDEGYQDPKDVAAIKEARENMGDYKLKTAKDYVVPESLRVNAEKKRIQLLNLLDQVKYASYFSISWFGHISVCHERRTEKKNLSLRRESNPCPSAHRSDALPLSYGETWGEQGHLLGSSVTRVLYTTRISDVESMSKASCVVIKFPCKWREFCSNVDWSEEDRLACGSVLEETAEIQATT